MLKIKNKVRVSYYPTYENVRILLPIWNGKNVRNITKLQSSIEAHRGTPQSPKDWKDPPTWIPEYLNGNDRELAEEIWLKSHGKVNPRHTEGSWIVVYKFNLMEQEPDGTLRISSAGNEFLQTPFGETEMKIDSQEGLVELLRFIKKAESCHKKDVRAEWSLYLKNNSAFNAPSVIDDTLNRRLTNLKDRDLIQSKVKGTYSLTDIGHEYVVKCDPLNTKVNLETTTILDRTKTTSIDSDDDVEYDTISLLDNGCFLNEKDLNEILTTWIDKKNLILQGPPGTGKTWLARRLAEVLLRLSPGHKTDRIQAVQFHANTSYEDFVQGYRPSHDRLVLENGPFLDLIDRATVSSRQKFVIVIEEINRGTPAQIFGELLTLLEGDKRNVSEALQLSYSDKKIYIPENVFVVGTMNTADRSLAIMDFALRRRFAFFDLKPCLNDLWLRWCLDRCNDESVWVRIRGDIEKLNDLIKSDPLLGRDFAIGHSFVTPTNDFRDPSAVQDWYKRVVKREILPLVAEYWFDDTDRLEEARKILDGE